MPRHSVLWHHGHRSPSNPFAQPQHFILAFANLGWRGRAEFESGHAAIIHHLEHPHAGIAETLELLRHFFRRAAGDEIKDGLLVDRCAEFDDLLAGQNARIDILITAPFRPQRVLVALA